MPSGSAGACARARPRSRARRQRRTARRCKSLQDSRKRAGTPACRDQVCAATRRRPTTRSRRGPRRRRLARRKPGRDRSPQHVDPAADRGGACRSPRGSPSVMRTRLTRRERARRRGRRLHLRRTIHRNVGHGGTPLDLAWRQRKEKPLRLVVLLDASGSMSLYTGVLRALPPRRARRVPRGRSLRVPHAARARLGVAARPRRRRAPSISCR